MNDSVVYGVHAVGALLANSTRLIKKIVMSSTRSQERLLPLVHQAEQRGIPIERLSTEAMNRRFAHQVHQGIVAIARPMPEYSEQDITFLVNAHEQPSLILVLDGITDPHNLGACLRTADAAGVHFILIPKDRNASVTPVVTKVACGATESIPVIRVTNLARAIKQLKTLGIWVYGAAGEASSALYTLELKRPTAFVMGAEGSGLRRLTRTVCDELFSLPMHGMVSSLNVSVATGVCLYEAMRQRSIN